MKKYLIVAVTLLLSVCLMSGCVISDYERAEALFNEGRIDSARLIYKQIVDNGGYKDSADKLLECTYMLANQFAEEENYVKAVGALYLCEGYKNSDELKTEYTLKELQNVRKGDTVYYGTYKYGENGSAPLSWTVLGINGYDILLLCDNVVEIMDFGEGRFDYEWESSIPRQWLNNEFYNLAFSSYEKKLIQKMITSDETSDMVFLLSAEEVDYFLLSNNRVNENRGASTAWWTRSYASGGWNSLVMSGGALLVWGTSPNLSEKYVLSFYEVGVRPVICINIDESTHVDAQNMSRFGIDSNKDLYISGGEWESNHPSSSGSSGSTSKKCIVCNGTGHVRYYYGSSDLEAILSGHDPYTIGECTSCNGTGKDR